MRYDCNFVPWGLKNIIININIIMADKKLPTFLLLVMLCLCINQCYCQWRTYTRFNGYIPSYTYPIQLNAGDSLSGYLTWPGPEDLDIYLYTNGSNLLSRTVWLDR